MILLFAFGKKGYAQMAYNLAFSLKHFNPEIEISIWHDGILNSLSPEQLSYFDKTIIDNTLDISTFKTRLYDISPYEESLYLDVDGIALKDIVPMIEKLRNKSFYVRNWGNHKLEMGDKMKHMRWAYAGDLWEHFNLSKETEVPATQTSLIWFKKTDEAKKIFDNWKAAMQNPLNIEKLREKWGGAQPDELYLNIALAKSDVKIDPLEAYMFFGNYFDNRTYEQLTRDFYFLSIYGNAQNTIKRYQKLYDQKLKEQHKAHGIFPPPFLYMSFLSAKHVNNGKQNRPVRKVIRRAEPVRHDKFIVPIAAKLKEFVRSEEIQFTLIHPSRGRARMAHSTMIKWMNSAERPENIQYIFSLDNDDKELNDYKKLFESNSWKPENIINVNSNLVEAIEKVTSKPETIQGNIIIVVSDDFDCPLNWDKSLLEVSEGKENFAIRANDGLTKPDNKIMMLPIVSRDLFIKLGYIYYPKYTGMFADNDLYEAADKAGEIIHAPQLLFLHKQFPKGIGNRDKTYQRHNHSRSWTHGENLLKQRRKQNFDLTVSQ